MTRLLRKHIRLTGIVLFLTIAAAPALRGQDTYYAEVGISGGGGFSLGDVNGILFRWMEPAAGAYIKYKINGHYAVTANFEGGWSGVGRVDGQYRRTQFFTLEALGEFNFFNFGAKYFEANSTWATPYVYAGIGMVYFNGLVVPEVPMGIGVKITLSDRLTMGAMWTVAKVLNDGFDYVDDPIGLNKGFWNNRDWNSTLKVFFGFNFAKICTPCRDGRVKF